MIHPLKTIRTYRRLRRYREVVFTLVKYGFDDIVDRISPDIRQWRRWGKRKPVRQQEIPTPARLRMALTDLGPTFVKFGQLLSTRPDILPDNYLQELEKLQDEVGPFPFEEVERIFLEELGETPAILFQSLDPIPIASGSIAQVHRGTLKSGEEVAVKVQRPGIQRQIETDLSILDEITGLIERRITELEWLRPREIVAQFATMIRRELDFIAEAQSARRFRENFRDDPSVYIPGVYWDYTTSRILVIDLIIGVKPTNLAELDAKGLDRKAVARNGAHAVLKEVFEHHFFHADPHPGNFFVLENNVIASVDFGIVGRLDEETVDYLAAMVSAVIRKNAVEIIRVARSMGLLGELVDEAMLKLDLLEFLDRYHGLSLGRLNAEEVIRDLLQILRRHHILLPVNLALVGRMLAISAGVGRTLDPDFDLLDEAKPYMKRLIARRYDPRHRLRTMMDTWQSYQDFLKDLPADLEDILAKVKKGKMLVSLHHEGLNHFILEMDRSTNRLTFGLIVAALIIGSSFVMQVDIGPTFYGLPALGLAGYLTAGVLGLWLVVAILRSGRI